MSSLRITKVNEQLRKLLGEIMERELSLKPGVIMTIAKIDTSPDLRYTRMFISVFPESETRYLRHLKRNSQELKAVRWVIYV
jgi:ribosome-binding factor A